MWLRLSYGSASGVTPQFPKAFETDQIRLEALGSIPGTEVETISFFFCSYPKSRFAGTFCSWVLHAWQIWFRLSFNWNNCTWVMDAANVRV